MAAWDQVPLEAPGALFSRQPDYADTLAKIMSSPGATWRANQESNRDYGLELDKAAANKKYQEGSLAIDAEKTRLTAAGQGPAGPFGQGAGAANKNILWRGSQPDGDPNSVEYQQAYAEEFLTPKLVEDTDSTGHVTRKYVYPTVPPGIKPPGGGSTAPSAAPQPDATGGAGGPVPAPAGGDPAAVAAATPEPPWYKPKTAEDAGDKKPTEAENRAASRLVKGAADYQLAFDNWDALGTGKGVAGTFANDLGTGIGGVGKTIIGAGTNIFMDEKYQQAATGVTSLAQDYLYAMSGANAPVEEAQKIIDAVMPKIGDKQGQLDAKKRTLQVMLDALKAQAGQKGGSPPPRDAAEVASEVQRLASEDSGAGGAGGTPAPTGSAGGAPPPPPPGFTIDPQ